MPHLRTAFLPAALALTLVSAAAAPLVDGGALQLNVFNGWKAFEVISEGDDPPGDGVAHVMDTRFDGAGAWLVNPDTLRVLVNHETGDASISEVELDLAALRTGVANMIASDSLGGISFVDGARQAYDRWSADGGASWTNTTSISSTSFNRFCSGQAYAADTFGADRGFVDFLYITGEEVADGRLFVLRSDQRDLYQLSGVVGSAPGGLGGLPFDSWENAALVDTGETDHVALLLSPDSGSEEMKLFIGEKGKAVNGAPSTGFLARNGLAYGSWYYVDATYPTLGNTNRGSFDTTPLGALSSTKLEDIDTSPGQPTRVVLGDQDSGVFTFDFELVFYGAFDAGASSFTITKIEDQGAGANDLDGADNVDWTAPTTLGGSAYPDGLLFVNEDTDLGEVWQMEPDGSNPTLIASTTVGTESSGIFDLSGLLGYRPGSVLITNNQGMPSSMSVLISPDATLDDSAWSDLGAGLGGTHGEPLLTGDGTLVGGDPLLIGLAGALESTPAYLCLGLARLGAPFSGGTMVPDILTPPGRVQLLFTDASGAVALPVVWPTGLPAGTMLLLQFWIDDPAGPFGFSASNGLQGTTP